MYKHIVYIMVNDMSSEVALLGAIPPLCGFVVKSSFSHVWNEETYLIKLLCALNEITHRKFISVVPRRQ